MGLAALKPEASIWDLPIIGNAQNPQIPQSQYPDIKILNTDSIEFTNNTTYPVSIAFTRAGGGSSGNAVFTDIGSLAAGASSAQQSPISGINNLTVNYTITNLNNGQTSTPCGVQIGTGPLRINILASQTNPDPVSIPDGGQIQFHPDVSYQLTFTPPNAFPNAPASISPTNSPALTATNVTTKATYSLTEKIAGTQGKGTVHIGS